MTRANPSRVRLRYAKHGKVRFTSHRDMARVWERALRRIDMPVAYSEGFNPRLKLHFGLALPTGFESEGEYLDIDIHPDVLLAVNADESAALAANLPASHSEDPESVRILDLELTRSRIDEATPDGISVEELAQIDRKELSLQQAVTSCSWEFTTTLDAPALQSIVDTALAADSLLLDRERKGKKMTDDIRPQILDVHLSNPAANAVVDGPRLVAELGTQPRALRPAEFLEAIDMPSKETVRVLRTHQWISNNEGEPAREPLVAGSTSTANTEVFAV